MSEDMANDSFQRIVNIDISNVVIGAMNEKHRNNPHLTCKCPELQIAVVYCKTNAKIAKATNINVMLPDRPNHGCHKDGLQRRRV